MSRAASTSVPAESDWLCEGCGYVLNGLPPGGRCPECGKPTGESAAELRVLPAWERPEMGSPPRRFLLTTAQVLFHPTRFYRSLATRGTRPSEFGLVHRAIASVLLSVAAFLHFQWFISLWPMRRAFIVSGDWYDVLWLSALTYVALVCTAHLAARLTTWEATYRGLRLPLDVVIRGLDYHAAHYLPVGLLAAITVVGFRIFLSHDPVTAGNWAVTYLYILCGEVVLSAAYLFKTYWIAMRNMMYASR